MEKLVRKLKRSNRVLRYLYYFICIFYFISLCLFIKSLISLKGIETGLRIIFIIFFILYLGIYILCNLINLIKKRYNLLIATSILAIIFSLIFSYGTYYINVVYNKLDNITEEKDLLYTTYLITLKDKEFNNKSKIGIISSDANVNDHALAEALYSKNKLANKMKDYDDYYALLNDLYKKKIDAIFVPGSYATLFSSEETFENIKEDTKIIYEHTEKLKNEDLIITSDKTFNEPLTFLLMGVDSTENGMKAATSFNGDTLMLISFNPKTLDAIMVSIPRDTYVPITCKNNNHSKINSAAAYGTNCVIKTVGNFLDTDIDYYVKINFKGLVDLVNALGGVEVDVEKPNYNYSNEAKHKGKMCEQNSDRQFGEHLVCVDPGLQILDGEQALAYARNRHLYIGGDLDRVRHQQQVVEAIAQKLFHSSLGDLEKILNVISNNLATNMEMNTILSGYQVAKSMLGNVISGKDPITINKAYLETYSLPVYLPSSKMYTSAQGYYKDSLEDIQKNIKITLGKESKEEIKTFSFSANKEYEVYSPGKNKRSGEPYKTMPNFVGKTVTEAEKWAKDNGIEFKVEYVNSDSDYFNPEVMQGLIANQLPHQGELLNTISSLTVYINNETVKEKDQENDIDDKEEDNNTTDDDIINDLLD